MYIVAPHNTDAKKLEEVKSEMINSESPKIKAYYDGEKYIALEGSHRIAAAVDLQIKINIIDVSIDDDIDHDFEDVYSNKVADILDYLSCEGIYYDIDNLY